MACVLSNMRIFHQGALMRHVGVHSVISDEVHYAGADPVIGNRCAALFEIVQDVLCFRMLESLCSRPTA